MDMITDEEFQSFINDAFDRLPERHRDAIKNVAIVMADEPNEQQRVELALRGDQTLLGLYQGVPLSKRQGMTNVYPPDKITLFKHPLLATSRDEVSLRENIYHTLWHEVAHYFGLDHDQIHKLEQ